MSNKPKLVLCRNCNTPILKNAKICPVCGAKNKKTFFKRWWFVLFIIILISGGVAAVGRNKKSYSSWNESGLCGQLPKPKSNSVTILSDSSDYLSMYVDKISS